MHIPVNPSHGDDAMGSQVCAQVKAPSPPACLATTAPRDTPLHGRLPPSSLSKNFPSLKPGFVWLVGFQYESFSTYSSENSVLALGGPRPQAPSLSSLQRFAKQVPSSHHQRTLLPTLIGLPGSKSCGRRWTLLLRAVLHC